MAELPDNFFVDVLVPEPMREMLVLPGSVGPPGELVNRFRGAWSSALQYLRGDIVTRGGSLWLALVPSAAVVPAEGPAWTVIAAAGLNGRGITDVQRTGGTGAAGSLDTYTITYSDVTTSTYQVRNGTNGSNGTNGVSVTGVSRISGNGAAGTTDTYRMTFSNGNTVDYTVVNGANGTNGRGFTPRGAWVSGTTYAVDDLVTSAGSTYRRVTAGAGTTAPADGATWELWAAKGADGASASAVPGRMIAFSSTTPSSQTTYSSSSIAQQLTLLPNFTVPASGRVLIELTAWVLPTASGSASMQWRVVNPSGSSTVGAEQVGLITTATSGRMTASILITSWAPGTVVNAFEWRQASNSSTQVVSGAGPQYGPLTAKVIEA